MKKAGSYRASSKFKVLYAIEATEIIASASIESLWRITEFKISRCYKHPVDDEDCTEVACLYRAFGMPKRQGSSVPIAPSLKLRSL